MIEVLVDLEVQMRNKKKDIKVYIASPYTKGWMPTNVRNQLDAATDLLSLGYFPYTPLLNHFQEIFNHHDEVDWMELDLVFVQVCDALLRLSVKDDDGNEIYSPGAEREIKMALAKNIPVFYNIKDLQEYFE